MTTGPIARIALRYLSGALVSYGVIAPDAAQMIATDPDVIAIVGAAIGGLTEVIYAMAKRKGWSL